MTTADEEPDTPQPGAASKKWPAFFWEHPLEGRHRDEKVERGVRLVRGADLVSLRRGVGQEPGGVPAMWRYYTKLTTHGSVTPHLAAEHAALTLFGIHQQSKSEPMHRSGIGLGTAMLSLRADESTSDEAVDRRFTAAATATSLTEVTHHLRGLITQLRALRHGAGQPLDYTKLYFDLTDWQDPHNRARVRRNWGVDYAPPVRKPQRSS